MTTLFCLERVGVNMAASKEVVWRVACGVVQESSNREGRASQSIRMPVDDFIARMNGVRGGWR